MTTKSNEVRHTKGPWEVYESKLGYIEIQAGSESEIVVSFGFPTGNEKGDATRIVACVNALDGIAGPSVVPELLGLCEEVLKFLDDNNLHICGPDHSGVCAVPLKRKLVSTLSRAKGKS